MMPSTPDGIKEGIELLFSVSKNGECVIICDDCLVALEEHSCDTHKPFVCTTPMFHPYTLEFLLLGGHGLHNDLVNFCFS